MVSFWGGLTLGLQTAFLLLGLHTVAGMQK